MSTANGYSHLDLVVSNTLTLKVTPGLAPIDRTVSTVNAVEQLLTVANTTANSISLPVSSTPIRSIGSPGILSTENLPAVTTSQLVQVDADSPRYGNAISHVFGNVTAIVTQIENQDFTTPGTYTWTVPAGVTSISVAGIGGGGGGSQKSSGGWGGWGGQLKFVNNFPVTPGDVYTVVVGEGGTSGGAFGNTGGDTYMYKANSAPILLASGGRGGERIYWTESTSSVTVYDAPVSPTFYTFNALSPTGDTITYSVSSGSLPNGVTLNSSTGVLGGNPDDVAQSTTYTFTVAASTATQTITRGFTLVVDPLPSALVTISPAYGGISTWDLSTQGNLLISTANVSYSITVNRAFDAQIKVWGAGGGGTTDGSIGGGGGYSQGVLRVDTGNTYRLIIGQGGGGVVGGRNAGGGGAGSGIEFASNSTPIIVAGGGGGGAQTGTGRAGGAGGGSAGSTGSGSGGAGGSQSAPGAGGSGSRRTGAAGSGRNGGYGSTGSQSSRFAYGFGTGGWGSYNGGDAGSGGGGGGYFGGGEGGGDSGGFGGGGGAGYIHPTIITNGSTTAGNAQTPGNNSDSLRLYNAGLGGVGGTSGSDGVNSSGFDGLIFIGSLTSTNPLGSINNPASNVSALRTAGITTDGPYWFSTTKQATPFQAYVKFNYIDGGDWALLLKVHSQGDLPSGSSYWTNTALYNQNDFNLTSGTWSKYGTWNGIEFTRLMMVMTQGGVAKIPPIMIFNTSRTFAEAITLAGGTAAANGQNNTVKADNTDPPRGNNVAYFSVPMKSGTAFTDAGGVEEYMQGYGIGMWANNASNATTAEGFASTGRAGAWIGCPLDDQGQTFNNNHNVGADSGFGFGFAAGNGAKTGSAGYAEWTNSTSTNTLPGYVWVR